MEGTNPIYKNNKAGSFRQLDVFDSANNRAS